MAGFNITLCAIMVVAMGGDKPNSEIGIPLPHTHSCWNQWAPPQNRYHYRRAWLQLELNAETSQSACEFSTLEKTASWQGVNLSLMISNPRECTIVHSSGDVIQSTDNITSVGSGAAFSRASAQSLIHNTQLSAIEIVNKALNITADISRYSFPHIHIETLEPK